VQIGVAAELEIARAIDSTDVDPLRVHALAVHEAVLDALGRLGFGFTGAISRTAGSLAGSSLLPGGRSRGSPRFDGINQLEVTFLTSESGTRGHPRGRPPRRLALQRRRQRRAPVARAASSAEAQPAVAVAAAGMSPAMMCSVPSRCARRQCTAAMPSWLRSDRTMRRCSSLEWVRTVSGMRDERDELGHLALHLGHLRDQARRARGLGERDVPATSARR
jgi:hypothetical protein